MQRADQLDGTSVVNQFSRMSLLIPDKRKYRIRIFPKNIFAFILRMAIFLVVLLCVLYLIQYHLLHHPDNYSISILKDVVENKEIDLWPSQLNYKGLMKAPKNSDDIIGTALVIHGNAGSSMNRFFYMSVFISLKYRVILLEYPGYGPREGSLNEKSLVADCKNSIDIAVQQFGKPIYLVGESLGAGVASTVLSLANTDIAGALLITPWDDLPNVAQSVYWYLPVKWIVKDSYDSVANLCDYAGNIGFVIAEHDEIIPMDCSLRLYNSYKGPKRKWIINDAGHNTWFGLTNNAWWSEVMEFVSKEKNK